MSGWRLAVVFGSFIRKIKALYRSHAMLPNPNTELLSVAAKAALSAARAWVENVKTIAMSGKSLARCAVIHAPDETAVVIVAHRVAAGESMLRWMLSRIVQGDPSPVAGRSAPFTIEKSVEAGRVDDLRNVLRGIQEPPELLGDNVRPSVQGLGAHSLRRVVSPDVAIEAAAYSHENHIGEASIYCAAFAMAVGRYTRKSDLLLACKTADGGMGFDVPGYPFDNPVVHRFTMSPDQTARDWMSLVDKVIRRGYTAAAAPFESLVDGLGLPRDPSRSPLTQILFGYEGARLPAGWKAVELPSYRIAFRRGIFGRYNRQRQKWGSGDDRG